MTDWIVSKEDILKEDSSVIPAMKDMKSITDSARISIKEKALKDAIEDINKCIKTRATQGEYEYKYPIDYDTDDVIKYVRDNLVTEYKANGYKVIVRKPNELDIRPLHDDYIVINWENN